MSLNLAGCGETDPSKANPQPEEKRAKYLDIHPPEPGKKAPQKAGKAASPRR